MRSYQSFVSFLSNTRPVLVVTLLPEGSVAKTWLADSNPNSSVEDMIFSTFYNLTW
nr:hypothetical protein [Orbus hercynius]